MAFLTNWTYRKKLTIDSTKVGTALTDFPVLVKLDNTNFDFSKAKSDGSDIRFTSSDGSTFLKYEREQHDSGLQEAIYWVKVPSVSDSVDTDIYIYYGNSSASDGEDPNNTWNNNYNAVYHLKESGSGVAGEFIDSTINANHGQGAGGIPTQTDSPWFKGQDGDGSTEYITIPDSDDFYFNSDFTVEWKAKWEGSVPETSFMGQSLGGGLVDKWIIWWGVASPNTAGFHFVSGGVSYVVNFSWIPSAGVQYHLAIKREGNNWKFFVDGTQVGGTQTNSNTIPNVSAPLTLLRDGEGFRYFNGLLDEVRITRGLARSDDEISTLYESDNNTLLTFGSEEFPINESESLQISDSIIVTDTQIIDSESLTINDTVNIQDTTEQIDESLSILDNIIISSTNQDAKYISKIISVNPLIFITDTNPVELVKVDITDPENPEWIVETISNINTSNDISIDHNNEYIYITGNDGKVIKIEIADLGNQITIDLNDIDNVSKVESNNNFGLIYASTNNNTGEIYVLDERDTFKIDSDIQALTSQDFLIDTHFQTVNIFRLDSTFTALSQETFIIDTDFKCLTKPSVTPPTPVNRLDVIEPIKLEDYRVFIDSVELDDTDLLLNSIRITHTIDQESQASFTLSRKHDNLNQTLEGVSSVITNQNTVKITIKGKTEFEGNISELDCQYNNNSESVVVNAFSQEKTNKSNLITMSLPGINKRLSLYDILVQNPKISNPVINPNNEDTPKKFKGIKVNLGTIIEQNYQRFRIFDSNGNIADAIQEGTFNPQQNWTYFWSPTVKKIQDPVLNVPETTLEEDRLAKLKESERNKPLNERKLSLITGEKIQNTLDNISNTIQETFDKISKGINELAPLDSIQFFYIGTSLAPVSEDLWDLKQATHWRQAINPDKVSGKISLLDASPGVIEQVEIDLPSNNPHDPGFVPVKYETYYKVGEAPFKEISVRNGIKKTKFKYVDEQDGLYSIKDEGYDYREYAKRVADLEYEKLKNINGDFLPDTSCTFNITIDGYQYYDISLLTRINVDNTTQSNIFKDSNGFPLSVKSITITSADRKVSLDADNSKSNKELEQINSQFPDEEDPEYIDPSQRILIHLKTDMRTRLQVERERIIREQRLE